jgi:hypothetical protein
MADVTVTNLSAASLRALQLSLPTTLLLFAALCAFQPDTAAHVSRQLRLPSLLVAAPDWYASRPVVVRTPSQAWALGYATAELAVLPSASLARAQAALENVGARVDNKDRDAVLKMLQEVGEETQRGERGRGASIARAFSLVNAAFFVGILGICLSIGPVLYPLIRRLRGVLLWAWTNVVSHCWRPFLFYSCLCVVSSSADARIGLDVRVYVSLLAALLSALALLTVERVDVIMLYISALLTCLAIATGSPNLLGFLAVNALFYSLGFCNFAIPGGYAIGFSGGDAKDRCLVLSTLFLSLSIASKAGVLPPYVIPSLALFERGLHVFGCTVFFLNLLIRASFFSSDKNAMLCRCLLPAFLAAGVVCGTLLPFPTLLNTSWTFSYFVAMDLIAFLSSSAGFFCSMLLSSLALCLGAYHAQLHPELVMALVS